MKNLIVLSPAWPSSTSGYGIALSSSLRVYLEVFPVVKYVVLTGSPQPDSINEFGPEVQWMPVRVVRTSEHLRFAASLLHRSPAVCVQFRSRGARRTLERILNSMSPDEAVVIVEDIPLGHYVPMLKKRGYSVAVRSHNVLAEAFEGLTGFENPAVKMAWLLETARIRRLERYLVHATNRFWSITLRDAEEYSRRYGCSAPDTFGVSIDVDRYRGVRRSPDDFALLTLGTADRRKAHGLREFVSSVWPHIRNARPSARFLIAGRGTESFNNPAQGVMAMGYVEDDREFLERGNIFVNTQIYGSGIKLKSLIAMAAGKALVSTEKGVEGVQGTEGRDFVVARDAQQLTSSILRLLGDTSGVARLGKSAQSQIDVDYSPSILIERSKPLLRQLSCGADSIVG